MPTLVWGAAGAPGGTGSCRLHPKASSTAAAVNAVRSKASRVFMGSTILAASGMSLCGPAHTLTGTEANLVR